MAEDGKVNVRIIKAIRKLLQEGGNFTVASFRMPQGIPQEIAQVCSLPMICAGGALVCGAGRILYGRPFTDEGIRKLGKLLPAGTEMAFHGKEKEADIREVFRISARFGDEKAWESACKILRAQQYEFCPLRGNLRIDISAGSKRDAFLWLKEHCGSGCGPWIGLGNAREDAGFLEASDRAYRVRTASPSLKKMALKLHSGPRENPVAEILARERGFYGKLHPLLHAKTILRHRREVYRLCCLIGLRRLGLLHDLSKFSPAEFFSGMKYYCGNSSPIGLERQIKGASRAWRHHIRHNKHHSERWVKEKGGVKYFLPVPKRYLAEQICDRIAACKVYAGEQYTQKMPYERLLREEAAVRMDGPSYEWMASALRLLSETGESALAEFLRSELKRENT